MSLPSIHPWILTVAFSSTNTSKILLLSSPSLGSVSGQPNQSNFTNQSNYQLVELTWHPEQSHSAALCGSRPQTDTGLRQCVWCRWHIQATPEVYNKTQPWVNSSLSSTRVKLKCEIKKYYIPMLSKNNSNGGVIMISPDQFQSQDFHYPSHKKKVSWLNSPTARISKQNHIWLDLFQNGLFKSHRKQTS